MPSGTRLEVSNDYIAKVEEDHPRVWCRPKDLGMIVSNIGVYPDLSAIYTTNASMDTAFVQTSLKEGHSTGSYEYMRRVRPKAFARDAGADDLFPGRRPGRLGHQSGPAGSHRHSGQLAWTWMGPTPWPATGREDQRMPNVSGVYIPAKILIIPVWR
jgi:hypothetical protein